MDSTTQLTIRRTGITTPVRTPGSPAPSGSREITHAAAGAYDPVRSAGSPHVRAAQVLEGNWTGTSTVPSRGLYPHQWSWDSAFIAIGLRHLSPLRAQTELETLLGAQWGDGRIPHIVFNPSVPLDAYFPSPDFWRSSTAGRAAGAPRTVQTSGIVQPPVHALAAWLVHQADPGLSRTRSFLTRMYPRLAAWHRYLLHRRDLGGGGLASVVHPWEQGMDNSPCWDAPLSRITPAPPRTFRRADLDHGSVEDRPTDLDYGRYVRLATDYRDGGYADGAGDGAGRFAVEDPAFNALLIASEHALAAIARELGAAGTARHARAERLTAALVERLWDPAEGMFFCRDVYGGDESGALGAERCSRSGDRGSGLRSQSGAPGVEQCSRNGAHGTEPCSRSGDRAGERLAQSGDRGTEQCSPCGAHESERRLRSGAHRAERRSPGGALIPERGVAGLLPLILPALPRDIATTLVRTAGGPHFGLGGVSRLVPSYDLTGHAFDPRRYWRGPAWFNTNWLLERGLRLHGEHGRAQELRSALLETADASGFAEYVDPYTGEACGALGFSWTAALTLDLLHEPSGADQVAVSRPGRDAFDTDTAQGADPHGTPPDGTAPNSSFETGAKGGDRG
ncbi:MGH1-like glycoside hydrolase domain-containing protein [Streptomyces fagopyri]|uniref:MGH1-like glycoside hydrolase domain-containing protein n=1 Tax=Streptomyces fagopyri TaxID=2662397 RepID=UPI003F4CD966